ncbi:MAG TPA: pilus assembly protein PilM [Polyangiaceae bacterium]|jgi:general secretion pathway protein L|nr:pilus assembly protein PilM [Polyangiaceae bacterium]
MPTWLGIDIGSANVKVAVVRSAYRKTAILRLVSGEITAGETAATVLQRVVMKAMDGEAQPADAIAVALEGSRVAIHRLLLPGAAQKQLSEVLGYELESQIPFEMSEALFDWRIQNRDAGDGQIAIVAAVARIEDVRARIDLVKQAVMQEPERVGVGALSLGALVPYVAGLGEDEAVAVVDLGAKASEVLVLEKGEAVFARTLSIGTEGLPATASRLAREIRLSFGAHRAGGGTPPVRVFLCGGGAFVSGAEGFLSGELEIPVAQLPPPALDVTALDTESTRDLPRYAKAIALALSLAGRGAGMNLRRGPLSFERGFSWVRERIPLLAGLAAVILVSFVFTAWARLYAVRNERTTLEAALGAVTKEVLGTEATTADQAQDLLAKENALTDEDPMPHADAFDVMVRLSEAIPNSMVHDIEELDVQKGHVVVHGVVGSIPDAQGIASTLSETPCMSDVKIKSTTQQIGSDRQKYVMEFDVKCPEDLKVPPKKKGAPAAGSSASAGGK